MKAWVLAIRPATLTAAVAPVLVGSALAARQGSFHLGLALAALLGALLIQIGTNLTNDVADFERGADTAARLGPTRVTQSGLIPLAQVRAAAWLAFGAAGLIGVALIAASGWPIAVLGAAAIASGWAYTAGPWPLGYHGLGDLFAFAFFGFGAVLGTAYVQSGAVNALGFAAALPVGALVTAILVVNNARDADTDRLAGKRTLAVRFGVTAARLEYAALLAVAWASPIALVFGVVTSAWLLLPLLTLPLGVRAARRMWRAADGPAFNALLAQTARLHLAFAALLAVGLLA
ncbi:MAG: 1,4-dihydroxy-2-naphthoate polyprenyltransferase [bacterium]